MIGAILFDVDGTLVDSNDLHSAAWQQAFRHFGVELSIEEIGRQIGKGGDNLIPALLPAGLVKEKGEAIEHFRSTLYRQEYLPQVVPFPGVRDLFERLYADNVRIVLATSSHKEELAFHRSLIGCEDLIHAATSRDDVDRSKPCPDIFEAALRKVAPLDPGHRALVVGDSPWDVKASRSAGLEAIALRCGGFPDDELSEAGPIALYDDPEELARLYPSWLSA
jgi:HAD superfamily hydrolase (TIGR01549 family)